MSDAPKIQDIQRRTRRLMTYEDGSWDLLLGTIFVLLSVYPITRARLGPSWNLVLFISLLLVASGIQMFLKWKFALPRLGYAKGIRSPKLKALFVVTIGVVILTFGVVVLTLRDSSWLGALVPSSGPIWLRRFMVDILVVPVMVGIFSTLGYLFGVARLYLYGWLLGIGNLTAAIIYDGAPEGFNVPLGLAAGTILVIGATLVVRFVRNYPVRTLDV
ncbi:MAG: hypothetical protein WBZ24_02095 [Anaerolineales bacterium]|jgi:hypothetical protein